MANTARLEITVAAARSSVTITVSSKGKYVSLPVNGIHYILAGQPTQPNASEEVFWSSVLTAVQNTILAN